MERSVPWRALEQASEPPLLVQLQLVWLPRQALLPQEPPLPEQRPQVLRVQEF